MKREAGAFRVDVPGEDDEPLLAAFCPDCAAREFGPAGWIDSTQTEFS
jgi:hypothetical protein